MLKLQSLIWNKIIDQLSVFAYSLVSYMWVLCRLQSRFSVLNRLLRGFFHILLLIILQERSTDFNPKDPYLLIHSEKDDKAFTVRVGDLTYNSISRGEDSAGHAIIQLLAVFHVFHLEYPQPLQNLYLYLQQFNLGDHDLCSSVRVVNSATRQFNRIWPFCKLLQIQW